MKRVFLFSGICFVFGVIVCALLVNFFSLHYKNYDKFVLSSPISSNVDSDNSPAQTITANGHQKDSDLNQKHDISSNPDGKNSPKDGETLSVEKQEEKQKANISPLGIKGVGPIEPPRDEIIRELKGVTRYRRVLLSEEISSGMLPQIGEKLKVELFPDHEFLCTVEKASINVNGTAEISGKIDNELYSYFAIATTAGKTSAEFSFPQSGIEYSVYPRGEISYAFEFQPSSRGFIEGGHPDLKSYPTLNTPPANESPGQNDKKLSDSFTPQDGNVEIGVMMVYTPNARAYAESNLGGIQNTISLTMSKSQAVLNNSQMGITWTLVHSAEVNYTESGSDTDLDRITSPNDGYIDEVHTWRETYGGDIVSFLTKTDDTGGLGWLLNSTSGNKSLAFHISRIQQVTWTVTDIHEAGHNMGAHHSKTQAVQKGPGLYSYSAGWQWAHDPPPSGYTTGYCTVMTYEDFNNDGTREYKRIDYFSSPLLSPSEGGGHLCGDANDGNNKLGIENMKSIIAAYCSGSSQKYNISGKISGDVQGGVTLTLSGATSATTTSAVDGSYSFASLADGDYTVTPSLSGYTFTPASQNVTISGADITGCNFTASAVPPGSYSISGAISGDVQGGVTLTLSGAASATTTSALDGSYSFTGLSNGNYTITPSLNGYTFTPASQNVTISGEDITGCNFTASAVPPGSYSISGAITGAVQQGVTLTLSGAATATTTSAVDGTYSFTNLANGNYTVTPSLSGYTFSPASQAVTIAGGDQSGINFTATQALTYSISGKITLANGSTPAISKTHENKIISSSKKIQKISNNQEMGEQNITSVPKEIKPIFKYEVERFVDDSGRIIVRAITPVKPPEKKMPAVKLPQKNLNEGINTLIAPAFDWTYGCTATSAGMMMGYYDRNGYPNMWDGGTCPLDNSQWGHTSYPSVTCGECPFIASHDGIAGRSGRGFVDDYWVDYLNEGDPYYGKWTEHTPKDCTGDFMRTGQYYPLDATGNPCNNPDGATSIIWYLNGDPFNYNEFGDGDGCYGMAAFVQSRGYSVISAYTQLIQGKGTDPNKGFTFADYQAEIDAGRPVIIHVEGHSMLGVGYNTNGSIVYLHDTWDYNQHQMTWGGDYSGMNHIAVTTMHISGGGGGGLAGVVVSDGTRTATTDANGDYTITGVPNGTYTVTPTLNGYTFTPPSRQVTVFGGNVTGCDFTAQQGGGDNNPFVTIGSTFTLDLSDKGEFDKKPTIYALINAKKKAVKVKTKSKDFDGTTVDCEWKIKCVEGNYDICAKGKISGAPFDGQVAVASVKPPKIQDWEIDGSLDDPGSSINVEGMYFGIKPKIWISYDCDVCGTTKEFKKTCKFSGTFYTETGESIFKVVVPKFKDGAYKRVLYIDSGCGKDSVQLE